MQKFGIDISRWQGNFDFDAALKDGVEFVIIKGGGGDDGLYVDSKFDRNYLEAKKRNLPVGVYWFSKAMSVAEAKKEAMYFVANVLEGKQFELPVYFDVETSAQAKLGKKALTDIALAWLNAVQSEGYWVGIYSYTSFINDYLDDSRLQGFAHWVAEWNTKCSYKGNDGVFGMWQFGGETNKLRSNQIAGQTVDQNYMLIDYPSLIKAKGLNGFKKQTVAAKEESPKQTTTYEVYTVKDGDTLWEIAEAKLGSGARYPEIKELNGLTSDTIRAGQTLKIPAKAATQPQYTTYTVEKGDNLWNLAAEKLGDATRYHEIKALNGLKSDTIYAGQVLKIPKK